VGLFDTLKSVFAPSAPAVAVEDDTPTPIPQPDFPTRWGRFDFQADPAAWYVVARHYDRHAEDPARVARILAENSIESEAHFQQIRDAFATYEEWVLANEGRDAWNELHQVLADADSAAVLQEYRQAFDEADTGMLEPIEGVSIQDYGRIAARLTGGEPLEAILASVQMDAAKYARVSEAWNQRMAQDTTYTLTGEYGKAFVPAASEAAGLTDGQPAFSWEQVTEAMVAMDHGSAAGLDPQSVLKGLGMSLNEYVTASQYWGDWFVKNAVRDPELNERYREMTERLNAKYATAKQDTDLTF